MQNRVELYRHFGKCLWLSNGTVELAASLDFGIRILRFSLCGGENVFYEQPQEAQYLCTEEGWRVYGGHRLWLAPESENTYWPDNTPVSYTPLENGVLLTQPEDGYLHVRKSIRVFFTQDPHEVIVAHSVQNCADSPLHCGLWSISAMRGGGTMRAPFAGSGGDMTPRRFLSLWDTTSLADARLQFTQDTVAVRHLPVDEYFKLGLLCREGAAAYVTGGRVFTKRFDGGSNTPYPDNNVNFEVYACRHMMEIESLAPLSAIAPGETAEHIEHWRLS